LKELRRISRYLAGQFFFTLPQSANALYIASARFMLCEPGARENDQYARPDAKMRPKSEAPNDRRASSQ
jgi:hypothetical protein